METRIKKIVLRPFKIKTDGWSLPGLVLKRDVNLHEAKHIMRNIFRIVISTRKDLENWEYKEYNKELVEDVNNWLRGEISDDQLMNEYAGDCGDDALGAMNLVAVIQYLQKENVL